MIFRKAQATEVDKVNEVIIQAAHRLKKLGSKQWSSMLNGEKLVEIKDRIQNGEVYIYQDNNTTEIAGIVYVYDNQSEWDKQLWGNDNTANTYYIHRLAIADKYCGKGMAINLLQELQESVEPQAILRLDCLAEQAVLNNLYQRAGFSYLTRIKDHDTGEQVADFNLYEWQASKNSQY
ncbi:putative acetyltransferase, GNAT superfamily [Gottschalkia purinilytica]|uniref:Putative acetyltransferase, GNAT superfamily n=2 Tax=Gottschalkia purinilytica TaxID=1503 RepID=A0A0L0WC76_GOTPU|nr:putative acetyltransferase, GNAT superfamily [Gottschalkia purinilytica]